MGEYIGEDNFREKIYQFEETDLVLAETDNVPLKELADRTIWLKNRLGSQFTELKTIAGNATLNKDDRNCMYRLNATGVINVTLPDAALIPHGAIIPFSSFCVIGGAINIKTKPGQPIFDSDGVTEIMHMHHKEILWLAAFTTFWQVVTANGNFYSAGEEIKARKERINTLALKGQILNREHYPRLWKYAQSLTMNQEIVPESTWNYDAFTYRGFFSTGDGLTTFRLPDERSMHERMLDLGRGISYSRNPNYAGGYEADAIKEHDHSLEHGRVGGITNDAGGGGWGALHNNKITENNLVKKTGEAENKVKTIGKLNLIKY